MGKIGRTGIFNLEIAICLGERKFLIQPKYTGFKIDIVLHPIYEGKVE